MEVDTVFSIANPYAFWYINRDFVFDEKVFRGLEKRFLEIAKEKEEVPRSTARYDKYYNLEHRLFESDLDEIRGKYIIPMTGMTIIDPTTGQKSIIGPFSNQNIVTTKMLEFPDRNPLEFLKRYVFVPISPIDIWFAFTERDEEVGIYTPFEKYIQQINAMTQKIGFGSLWKSKEFEPKQGNYNVYAGVLESKFAINRFNRHPESFHFKLRDLGCDSAADYEKYCNSVASFCKKILAQKYVVLFNKLNLLETLFKFKIPELMLFGEKTSYAAKVLELVQKYSSNKYKHSFIGDGPLSSIKEITTQGVAHDSAMSKLEGFIAKQYEAETKKFLKRPENRELPAWESRGAGGGLINYRRCPKYNWFLCEFPGCESPCGKDVIDKMRDEKKLTPKIMGYIKKLFNRKRSGISRVEARLAQLANQDFLVYVGERRRSKLNSSWQNIELSGKHIEFLDLRDFVDHDPSVGDLRGSEFTAHCDVARLFGKLDRPLRKKIIAQELLVRPEFKEDFFKSNDSESFEGIAAIVGTAAHAIISAPFPNLAHYDTLAKAGLEVVPSDFYTELSFRHKHFVKETGEEISITFHPDVNFFLQHGGESDLVIIDHKTNRRIPYPYLKYLMQGKVYTHCMEKITGIQFTNRYLLFNHMAFDNAFGVDWVHPEGYTGSQDLYRQQAFIPPTVYYPEHWCAEELEKEFDRTFLVQKNLKQSPDYFFEFKQRSVKTKCNTCFSDQRLMCSYFTRKAAEGLAFLGVVEELKR